MPVPRRDSLLLADRFADPLVIEHRGGHVIPGDRAVTGPIAEFLAGFSQEPSTAPAGPGAAPALDRSRGAG